MQIAVWLAVLALGGAGYGEGHEMMLGEETGHSKTLLGEMTDSFYGLQITPRGGRTCQVRAYFRGSVPQTAQYCSGRVTARHMRRASVAVVGLAERVHGISACLSSQGSIASVRLHTGGDAEFVEAGIDDCATDYRKVQCSDDWAVQGVQLFFDGRHEGRAHRRLMGIRPLCSVMLAE